MHEARFLYLPHMMVPSSGLAIPDMLVHVAALRHAAAAAAALPVVPCAASATVAERSGRDWGGCAKINTTVGEEAARAVAGDSERMAGWRTAWLPLSCPEAE